MTSEVVDAVLPAIEVDASWLEETDLIFLGTGSSGGTPKLTCITGQGAAKHCPTCFDANLPGSPNNRRNTSAIIRTQWFAVRNATVLSLLEGEKS